MGEIVIKLANAELAGQSTQTLVKNYREAALAADKAAHGTQEWVNAQNKLADAKGLLADNKAQIEATTKASFNLKQSFGNILDQIPGFSAIRQAMQGATSGVGGLTSGFGLLKGAIAATGIGLLVIAVSTLVMWFSKTEAGGNVLAGTMRALGAVVNLLFGKVMEIGKALFEAFNNPKQLLNDLVQFLEDQVMNRFKAFGVAFGAINKIIHGDFKQGLKELADSAGMWTLGVANITDKVGKLGKEFADAAVEGYNFVQAMDDIEDRQAAMEVTAKRNENIVNQLLLQAKNVGKTFEDRIALLDKADAITRQSYNEQLKLSKEYLDAINAEINAEKKQQGVQDDTDEMRDKRKDAELKYLEIQGQGIELEEKIANRREQIIGKQEKADEKAAAALQKRLDEEAKALEAENKVWQKIEDQKIEIMDESREKDLAHLQLSLQREIEALDVNAPTYAAALSSSQELARKKRDDINTKWDKTDSEKAKKAADDQKKIALDKQKYEANLANIRLETEKGVVDGVGELLLLGVKNERDAKGLKKIIALSDIGFNLGKELSANALAAAENPLNGITFGAAGAGQLAASNLRSIVFAGINVARVLAFKKGGYTGSGSNDEIAGAVHKNEYVIPASITTNPDFSGIINTLEAARLNGYQVGGMVRSPINPYTDVSRSPIANNSSPANSIIGIDYDKMASTLAPVLAEHTRNEIHKILVIQSLQETKKGLDTIQTIQTLSNV